MKFIKLLCHKHAQRKEETPRPFVDDFAYDLGYYQSNAMVIFCMGLVFSGVIPLISLFLMLYFFFRYYIDKYNLIFVYNKEFEGGGIIVKKQVLPLMFFSLYLFQILNFFYFSIIDVYYFKAGLVFMAVQTMTLVFFNVYYGNKKRDDRKKLSDIEQVLYTEESFDDEVEDLDKE